MTTTTFIEYNGDGSDLTFNYSFPTYKQSEVKVAVSGVLVDNWTITGGWAASGTKEVKFDNTTGTTNAAVCNSSTGAPLAGTNNVRIYRDTDIDSAKYTFNAGSSIKADELNTNHEQLRRALQEEQYNTVHTYDIRDGAINTSKILDGTIVNVDISSTAEIAVSKLADGSARQVLQTAANGSDVEWTSNVDIPGTLDVQGNTKLEGNLDVTGTLDVNSATNLAGVTGIDGNFDINTNKFTVAAATGNTTVAGTLVVTGVSTHNNNLNVGGVLDVTGSTVLTGSLDANAGASIDNVQIGVSGDNEIDTASGNLTIDSAGGTVTVDDNLTVSGTITGNVTGTITGNVTGNLTGNADTATDLAAATKITASEQAAHTVNDTTYFTTSATEARYFNTSTGETIKDGDTFPDNDTTIATTAAINDRIIDLVDDVGGFVPIANETSFPNANPDVNNGTGTIVSVSTLASNHTSSGSGVITISNGTVGNSTVTINGAANSTTYSAGYGLLVETTSTLNTYTFHRLVPKATEVTTVAGKATEIGRLGTAAAVEDMGILGTAAIVEDMSLIGTTACVADMALLGDSAVIADMATIADTSNLISNIGTVAGIQANVTTVAGISAAVSTTASNIADVNNFANTYQIASSAPSTDGGGNALAAGDLYFDTSASELKVRNAANNAWQGGVTATGNLIAKGGDEFTGAVGFTDGSTSAPSIYNVGDTNTGIYFGAADEVDVTVGGTTKLEINSTGLDVTGNITVSGTVDGIDIATDVAANTAKVTNATHSGEVTGATALTIADNIVDEANLKIDNSPTNDYVITAKSSAAGGLTWAAIPAGVGGATGVDFNDDVKVRWGTGNDLEIYSDGDDGLIYAVTDDLRLQAVDDITLKPQGGEDGIEIVGDGGVSLFYDGTKKLQTNATGIQPFGNVDIQSAGHLNLEDSGKVQIGNSQDLQIYHSGGHNYCDIANGQVLYFRHNSANKFYVQSGGAQFVGSLYGDDDNKIELGNSQDLQIYHSSGINEIRSNGAKDIYIRPKDTDIGIKVIADGSVELMYDGSEKIKTVNGGVEVTGDVTASGVIIGTNFQPTGYLKLNDDQKIYIGTGNDFQIYHDGNNSVIENTTNDLYIKTTGSGDDIIINSKDNITLRVHENEDGINITGDGGVQLYYNNVEQFFTKATGAEVTTTGAAANFVVRGKEGYGASITLASDDGDDPGDYARILQHTDETLYFQVWNAANNAYEDAIVAKHDGAVEQYYDNAKKTSTQSYGLDVYGLVFANDYLKASRGASGNNAHASSVLVLEDDADIKVQLLTPAANSQEIRFGDDSDNGAGWIQYSHSNNEWSVGTNGTQRFYINSAGSLYAQGVYDATTGSGANVEVSSGGKLRRSTSSQRYKTNIETLEDKYADAILEARPVWYKSLCEDDNKDHGHWGFIAEEIEKIDPRLCTYKTVEIETNRDVLTEKKLDTPIVESVQYDRFVPHLLNLIKRQDTKIKALETKVAALEAG